MVWQWMWFVLAGFVLGFAVSTLWEWLFFRRERMLFSDQRVVELEARLRDVERARLAEERSTHTDALWTPPDYEGSGFYLESERVEPLVETQTGQSSAAAAVGAQEPAGRDRPPQPITPTSFASVRRRVSPERPGDSLHVRPFPTVDSIVGMRPAVERRAAGAAPRADVDVVANLPSGQPGEHERPDGEVAGVAADVDVTIPPAPAAPQPVAAQSRVDVDVTAPDAADLSVSVPTARVDVNVDAASEPANVTAPRDQSSVDAPVVAVKVDITAPRGAAVATAQPPASVSVGDAVVGAGPAPRLAPLLVSAYPDNLSKIKGIGRVYRQRLYRAGVYTWHQVAEMTGEQLRVIVQPPVSADVEEWPGRARVLAEKHGRIGAAFFGPAPDDLMQIRGIGPHAMQLLYRSGIFTYAQLSTAEPEVVAQIVPTSPNGSELDYARWIRDAVRLARQR